MNYFGCELLSLKQQLESLQVALSQRRQWEAAKSLTVGITLLAAQIEIEALDYERQVKG